MVVRSFKTEAVVRSIRLITANVLSLGAGRAGLSANLIQNGDEEAPQRLKQNREPTKRAVLLPPHLVRKRPRGCDAGTTERIGRPTPRPSKNPGMC